MKINRTNLWPGLLRRAFEAVQRKPSNSIKSLLIVSTMTSALLGAAAPAYANVFATIRVSTTGYFSDPVYFGCGNTLATVGTLTCSWTFGDGQVANGNSPSHKYSAAGTYTTTVTVCDAESCSSISQGMNLIGPTSAPPASAPCNPIVNIGGPYSGYRAGDSVPFLGADSNCDHVKFVWEFGDGTGVNTEGSPGRDGNPGRGVFHIYSTPGTYAARMYIRVLDTFNETIRLSSTTTTVIIDPAPPTPSPSPFIAVHEYFGVYGGQAQHLYDNSSTAFSGHIGVAFYANANAIDSSMTALKACYYGSYYQFLTVDANCEGQHVVGNLGYVSTYERAGYVPLYRYWNRLFDHFTTTNRGEGDASGYSYDGIIGYVPIVQ
jgi:chitodextrinase